MKRLLPILLFLAACNKPNEKVHTCEVYCWLADRYSADSVYHYTDTLEGWGGNLTMCGAKLDSCHNNPQQWFIFCNCTEWPIECRRFVFNNELTQPYLFR